MANPESFAQHKKTTESQNIGKIIEGDQIRDAVHIAIAPVEAGRILYAGLHVGLVDGKAEVMPRNMAVGIVDPFLANSVLPGEKFWLFLYPNTITALKHVWEHPAFGAEQAPVVDKSSSEVWMRAWAMRHMSADYYGDDDGVFDEDTSYANAISAGHKNSVGPYEEARDHINDEWWEHWEIITGQEGDREAYFSCAC